MYKAWLKAAKLDPFKLQFKTGIPQKRTKQIYADKDDPWRGEVLLVDKVCEAGGLLVSQYCATRCPEGKYLGLRWPDISLQTASLQIIDFLSKAERNIPLITETCLRLARGERPNVDELDRRLEEVEIGITAARLQIRAQVPNKTVATGLRAYMDKKEKTTCDAAQAAM